jgi:hypothetical protein
MLGRTRFAFCQKPIPAVSCHLDRTFYRTIPTQLPNGASFIYSIGGLLCLFLLGEERA